MTDGNGDRQYGFCRRRTPRKNQRELYTECLCIVSYYPWFNLFNQMLQYLEERRETVEHRRETLDPFKPFLQAVQAHPLPVYFSTLKIKIKRDHLVRKKQTPGDQFRIRIASEFVDQKLPMHYFLQRPDETATGLHHVSRPHGQHAKTRSVNRSTFRTSFPTLTTETSLQSLRPCSWSDASSSCRRLFRSSRDVSTPRSTSFTRSRGSTFSFRFFRHLF